VSQSPGSIQQWPLGKIFTAVVTLGSDLEIANNKISETFKNRLEAAAGMCGSTVFMPHFVGCLGGTVVVSRGEFLGNVVKYAACKAIYDPSGQSLNIGFGLLLLAMRRVMWPTGGVLVAAIPKDVPVASDFDVTVPR
jgi:hypothetical protein